MRWRRRRRQSELMNMVHARLMVLCLFAAMSRSARHVAM